MLRKRNLLAAVAALALGAMPGLATAQQPINANVAVYTGALVTVPTYVAKDLGIYAIGPWAQLFQGTVEENYTFHVMDFASKISERANQRATREAATPACPRARRPRWRRRAVPQGRHTKAQRRAGGSAA